jgi:ADP-ribose pyrophosphatase YjhB (NUDIX family)
MTPNDNTFIPEEEYQNICSKFPRLCLDLIIKQGNLICLGRRSHDPFKGKWSLPGGRLLVGENIKDGINRIAQKELSIDVVNPNFVGYIDYQIEKDPYIRHSISLVFYCEAKGFIKFSPNSNFDDFHYYDNDKDMINEQRELLQKYLQQSFFGFFTKNEK